MYSGITITFGLVPISDSRRKRVSQHLPQNSTSEIIILAHNIGRYGLVIITQSAAFSPYQILN